jgi:hypothetical protein
MPFHYDPATKKQAKLCTEIGGKEIMAKPHRLIKKANHGARPANAKARRAKRRKVRT